MTLTCINFYLCALTQWLLILVSCPSLQGTWIRVIYWSTSAVFTKTILLLNLENATCMHFSKIFMWSISDEGFFFMDTFFRDLVYFNTVHVLLHGVHDFWSAIIELESAFTLSLSSFVVWRDLCNSLIMISECIITSFSLELMVFW